MERSRGAAGPIGLFDSGIGGATVLIELQRALPHEDFVLLADQARCPYGPRPAAELEAIAIENVRWLLAHNAKLIVVACNTASAAALHALRAAFPAVPFVGMVPAVKPAALASRTGVVGVLATPATIAGDLLRDVVERWAHGVRVVQQACPGLVEQVEAGALATPETLGMLREYLAPLQAAGADAIVLGCTHYPFLLPQIRQIIGPSVAVYDAAAAVARQVTRLLAAHHLQQPDPPRHGRIAYTTSAEPAHLAALIAQLHLPAGRVMAMAVPATG
ncbi:MAG TPA: glutamate racemase [Roseiflexaceae bacterium]|nr:glutamate racemase [Roseiflexaceae bacterium]